MRLTNINLLVCRTLSGKTPLAIAYDKDADIFDIMRDYLSVAASVLNKDKSFMETIRWKDLPKIAENLACNDIYTCEFRFEAIEAPDFPFLNGKTVFSSQTANIEAPIIPHERRSGWLLICYGNEYKGLPVTVESTGFDTLKEIGSVAKEQGIKTWGDLPKMPRSVHGVTTSVLTDISYVEGTIFGCFNANDPIR